MNRLLHALAPQRPSQEYQGHWLATHLLLLIGVGGVVRSLIHIFAPDGGAGSIAGMDLSVEGAEGIILAFALWGSSQLLLAVVQLVVWFRYRALIPFMYVLILSETLLRLLIGQLKPASFAHTPPGTVLNWVLLPVGLLLFTLSLRGRPGRQAA